MTADRTPLTSPDPTLLTAYLDDPYGDLAARLRGELAKHADLLDHAIEETRQDYRERVLKTMLVMAESGHTGLGFPTRFGGGGDIGGSIAAIQTLAYFDLSLLVKAGVQFGLFGGAILHLGTERHHDELLADVIGGRLLGCFAMTETAHGSNVAALATTATYDPSSDEFVIWTPSDDARKDYIGNAATHGRLAVVFAQLVVGEEQHGIHALVVPIRDAAGEPMPGVRIEDCGAKLGLEGVDNGRLWFDGVRVPRPALLNRYADVDEHGNYSSSIASPERRFFTMLGTLVQGRVSIAGAGLGASKVALTIATRYANRRRQFGPPPPPTQGSAAEGTSGDPAGATEAGSAAASQGDAAGATEAGSAAASQGDAAGASQGGAAGATEATLMSYRTHQRRLLPLLARTYALSAAQRELMLMLHESFTGSESVTDRRVLESRAAGQKALATWHATETIQICREACGGAGYLAENRFAALKADTDVFTTFEGDNTVLLQLVAKGLLTEFRQSFNELDPKGLVRFVAGQAVGTVVERAAIRQIVERLRDVVPNKDDDAGLLELEYVQAMLRWREEHMRAGLARRLKRGIDAGAEPFEVFATCQDHVVSMAQAHVDRVVLEAFVTSLERAAEGVRPILTRLCFLHGLATIEADRAWFLEHGRLSSGRSKGITAMVGMLCEEIAPLAETLTDGFAIPEELVRAPIAVRR